MITLSLQTKVHENWLDITTLESVPIRLFTYTHTYTRVLKDKEV